MSVQISVKVKTGQVLATTTPPPATNIYLRPGGSSTYLRPGGVDTYTRP